MYPCIHPPTRTHINIYYLNIHYSSIIQCSIPVYINQYFVSLFYVDVKPGQMRVSEHSDGTTITFLIQDEVAGYQVSIGSNVKYSCTYSLTL